MIEEDVFGIGGVCGDITIARLGIIWVFGVAPLDGWPRRCNRCGVAFGVLYPALGHRVVTQISDNVVISPGLSGSAVAPFIVGTPGGVPNDL